MFQNAIDLDDHLNKLQSHFLPAEKLLELSKAAFFTEDNDARAFLVLAHSAFEQFFEDCANDYAQAALAHWLNGRLLNKQLVVSLGCMAAYPGALGKAIDPKDKSHGKALAQKDEGEINAPTNAQPSEPVDGGKPYEDPRAIFTNALRTAENKLRVSLSSNHGAAFEYLRDLYTPLGIYLDVPPDARSALARIANARGTFAHRRTPELVGKFALKPIGAKDAIVSKDDLLKFCKTFETYLKSVFDPKYFQEEARNNSWTELVRILRQRRSSLEK